MQKIAADNEEHKLPYSLSLSLGSATFDPEKTAFLEQLMQEADQQLYQSKSSIK